VNTQTTVGVNRLAIKPVVTIGDSIVKVLPKKVQTRKFSSLVPQNSLARSTGIASKSKSNEHGSPLQQKWKLGQSRESDLKDYSNNNVIIKIDRSIAERALQNLTDQTQTSDPKFFKLSDAIVKCLMSKRALLKDVRLQSANDRSARKMNNSMANSSKLDHEKILNVSSSNTRDINSFFDFKKRRNNTRKEYCKLKSEKSDVHNAIETRSSKYQKKLNGKTIIEMNESNRNDTDDNVKSKHRIKNVTAKVTESTYEQTISTENTSLRIQQESTGVTQRINDSVYRYNDGVTPALRRHDSTISEVPNGTIYMTTPKANIINVHGNETRNSGATNSNRRNKKTFKKNSSKSARRKQGFAQQKHHDDCCSSTTTTRIITRFGIDAIGETDATVKSVNNYMRTSNAKERNMSEATRKKQTSATTSDLTNTTKDYFLLMVKKHRKLLDYYNKYNSMKSKMPIPDNIEKHKKDITMYSTMYNQTQRSVLSAHETFVTESTEIDKIDYSSIKIENLLYESNSPNVKLTRYFTKSNQTFNDIDKMVKNVSYSSHKLIQRSRHRGKENCNPNKMHKRSNFGSRKLYNESSTTMKTNNNIDSGLISSDEAVESMTADNCTYSEETRESRETLEEGSKNDFEVLLNWSKPSSITTSSPKLVTQFSENGVKRNNQRGHNNRRRNDRKNNRSKNRRKNHNAEGNKKHTTVRQTVEMTSVNYSNDYSPEPRNVSPNDPRYDKAGHNQNGSTGRNNWFTTDESTTEYFKVKSSDVDESVTEHLASTPELQSEGTMNLIADGTTSSLPMTSDGRSLRKSEAWITTTTESSWFGSLWSSDDEEVSDEKSIDCKDLVWFLITSSPVEKEETKETRYASISPSDDFTFPNDNEVTPVSIMSSREAASKETDETDEERSVTYSTVKSWESKRGMTDKLISSEKSNENSEKAYDSPWDWKTVTHSVTGGTTHDAVSDFEEEENGEERASFGEDGEIENGVQSVTEDYEGEHCGKNQHACDKYTCIEEDKVCDGTADCLNANDEIDCEYIFRREEHANGGFGELDHSSRDLEVTSSNECSFYEHPCDGGCINALSVCDGETDCLDGTDEENCTDSEGIFCAGIFWSTSSGLVLLLVPVVQSFLPETDQGRIRTSRNLKRTRRRSAGSIYHLRCTENGFERDQSG